MTDVLLPPPPASPPPDVRGDRRHPALDRRRALPVLLLGGLALDAVMRNGAPTVAAALALTAVGVGVLVAARTTNRTAWLLVAAAVAVAVWLPLRTSPWLVPVDVLVAGALIAVAVTYARGGHLGELTFAGGVARGLAAPGRSLQGIPVLGHMVGAVWQRRPGVADGVGPALARGLVLAIPVVAALAVLLASADAVFASFFRVPFSPGSALGHVVLIALGVLLTVPLLLEAAEADHTEPAPMSRLGSVETTVLLGAVVVLYAAFAAAQAVVALAGPDHVVETTGLTYAEYARTGFFQLLAVAGLTLLLLLGVRGTVRPADGPARRSLVVLAEATVVLTLVIVGVAVRRLDLYDDVFGLTMLRLSSTVAACWIGGVFVLVGLAFAGLRRGHDWLAGAVVLLSVATLVGYNAADPEALVVRHNVARDASAVPVDLSYLVDLSDDAVPALEGTLDDLEPAARQATVSAICAQRGSDPDTGPLAWNLAADRAAAVRARLC